MKQGYVVGVDEAGYGPNLGPLVVSATVWEVACDPRSADLYHLLRDVVSPTRGSAPAATSSNGNTRLLLLADSKLVYKPGGGLRELEFGVLSTLAWAGKRPTTWRELWQALDGDGFSQHGALPWHIGYDRPLDAEAAAIDRQAAVLRAAAKAAGVRLAALRSRAVFPELWNLWIDRHGNKSTVLSLTTLELLAEVLEGLDGAPVFVICDKHGGRNSYRPLVQSCLTDELVEVYDEGREESRYGWGHGKRRVEVAFRARAERYLPAALASMASKFLRELAMDAFNAYWLSRVPGLARTAGYPGDAARFKAQIASAQHALGIDERAVWRNR